MKQIVLLIILNFFIILVKCKKYPIVINTWNFSTATAKGKQVSYFSFVYNVFFFYFD